MNLPTRRADRTWPYALAGAALLLGALVLANAGEYEGLDVIVFLGPFVALLGAGLGAFVGIFVQQVRGR